MRTSRTILKAFTDRVLRVPGKGLRRGRISVLSAVLLAAATAGPAGDASQPSGPYTGMGTCPLHSSQLLSSANGSVGCVVATVNGGNFTVGGIVVPLPATSPITVKFGMYWPENGPVATFEDGNEADIFSTVAPTDGRELTASALNVPIPGISNFWPGVTSAITQIELAGPITNFTPLSAGENYPLFRLPIKLHLLNAFLGLNCYVGSNSSPIILQPTAGTTAPPAPNHPITGDPGTIGIAADPNGFGAAIVGFTGATLVDNSYGVPGANGCGIAGSANWIVNLLFGLSSASGHNSTTFANLSSSIAVDTSISDLTSAIQATQK